MNQRIRLVIASLIALSVIGLLILIFAHYHAKDDVKVTIDIEKGVGVEITKLHYSGVSRKGVTWEMDAERAQRIKGSDVTLIQGIKAVFHSKDGVPYTLAAADGRFNEADGLLDVKGGVVLKSEAGETLTTDNMHYASSTRKITTSEPVTITSPSLKITGVGLHLDLDTGKVKILKDVKAVVNGVVS